MHRESTEEVAMGSEDGGRLISTVLLAEIDISKSNLVGNSTDESATLWQLGLHSKVIQVV